MLADDPQHVRGCVYAGFMRGQRRVDGQIAKRFFTFNLHGSLQGWPMNFPGARRREQEISGKRMWIMVVYVLIVLISESIVVAIGLALDRVYRVASLPVSLTLFFTMLWLSWVLAVYWTEPKRAKHRA